MGGTTDKRKMHWVSWGKVIAPKDKGGLGVGSIYALNIGLIVKWWWRLKISPSSLWCRIITGIHRLEGKPAHHLADVCITGVWKNIAKADSDIRDINLSFSDILQVQEVNNSHGSMEWRCAINTEGRYTVESLRTKVDQAKFITSPSLVVWSKEIPIKVLGFVWKAAQGRIASADALLARGIQIGSTSCTRCGELEDANHILFNCPFTAQVRTKISNWCGISFSSCNNIISLVEFVNHWGRCPKKRKLLIMVVYGMLWRTWNFRNEKVFKNRSVSVSGVYDDIISTVFFWAKHRAKWGRCNRDSWNFSPFTCL